MTNNPKSPSTLLIKNFKGGLNDWAMLYGMRYTSGSFESTNLLLSIPGIKACIKNAFTQQEMINALVIHFGMVNLWTKIFTVEPGTENSYLPALRNANKRLFFLCRVIFFGQRESRL